MAKNILTDAEIELKVYKSRKDYPENLRLIRYYDEEQDREFLFLTNAMVLTAQQIADLYKNRWQIELFFYDKYSFMRTLRRNISDYQTVIDLLLISTYHNKLTMMPFCQKQL